MQDQGQQENSLDFEFYADSHSKLRKLRSKLPEDSVETLAREVIRRLTEHDDSSSVDTPADAQIELLCHALVAEDSKAGAAYINEVRSAGVSIDAVYLRYLARAARMLGHWWDIDALSFPQVALGTGRMYAIMRAMHHQMPIKRQSDSRSAVFVSVPGETHTLGVRMAADLFRKDGWEIDLRIDENHDSLVAHIVESRAMLVGISAGGKQSLQALSQLIVALRIRMPTTALFISGQITEEAIEAIKLIGVDGIVSDIDEAKKLMGDLWVAKHEQ
ncbi:Methanogenic corrinoid protein MtbC1 [Loktanella fryxellensis]|uniref:Methanogenic corrinoid protein MtbC1 n=1 Tax=Loktanella fryxellensis TaxID=245187 RepID=A0A1H7ZA10_9RHOB|nr:cobalamin B12-binding domain-containing protein [Loktanella fryxellensis]SEM54844.1 Methanogenic corrinoid protein MtbC1 [Loktanella fryxellensis]